MKSTFLCNCMLLWVFNLSAQTRGFIVPDTLKDKDSKYLRERFQETKREDVAVVYANSWLVRSKAGQDYVQMALAYQAVMHKSKPGKHLRYADSIIGVANLTKDLAVIGSAYLTKGTVYYNVKKHALALDHYLMADGYISRANDRYLAYKVKYAIAQTKYYLGFYDEAIALFKECLDFFKEENDRGYLNSLHHLGLCYNKIRRYDLCSRYNKLGIEAGVEFDNFEMEPYFNHSEGINQYFRHNYSNTVKLIRQALPAISARNDFANEIVAWFYLGKAYRSMGQKDLAFTYFNKVDAAIVKEKYIRPELRENFEILIDHYKQQGNLQQELRYVNRLMQFDNLLHTDFRYLSGKVHKEYDTKKLLQSKVEIENTLRSNRIFSFLVIALLAGCVIYTAYRYCKRERHYLKKFEELKANDLELVKPSVKAESTYSVNISPEVEAMILKRLEKFEQGTKFLEPDMSSRRLADILHTNTKYVSWIIPKYRGVRTIDYVSDLKIGYMVKLLKTEKTYRKYTNSALADKAGFGSTQIFTKAFKVRAGISPTDFIEELRKKEEQVISQ